MRDPEVSETDERAALEDLRTAHRILMAASGTRKTRWVDWLLSLLLLDWLFLWLTGDFSSPAHADELELDTAREQVRSALRRLRRPAPPNLDRARAPELRELVRELFESIRARAPSLHVEPL